MSSRSFDLPTGWQRDPFGAHELRLFSPEGKPTAHVRDGGRNSYEEMPGAIIVDPPRGGAVPIVSADRTPPGPEFSHLQEPSRDKGGHFRSRTGRTHVPVGVHQLARLVVGITLLITLDHTRRLRAVIPALSTIALAALAEVPAHPDPLEPTSGT